MIFDWYLVFNLTEFIATELVSRKLTLFLEGRGEKEILIVKGNEVSIVYADVMMPVGFNAENPFVREGEVSNYAVFKDASENVYIGFEAVQ